MSKYELSIYYADQHPLNDAINGAVTTTYPATEPLCEEIGGILGVERAWDRRSDMYRCRVSTNPHVEKIEIFSKKWGGPTEPTATHARCWRGQNNKVLEDFRRQIMCGQLNEDDLTGTVVVLKETFDPALSVWEKKDGTEKRWYK